MLSEDFGCINIKSLHTKELSKVENTGLFLQPLGNVVLIHVLSRPFKLAYGCIFFARIYQQMCLQLLQLH